MHSLTHTAQRPRISFIIPTLVVIGLLSSLYLLRLHFAMSDGADRGFDVCSVLFGGACDAALLSSLSMLWSIPLAGWGVIYYALQTGLLLHTRYLRHGLDFDASSLIWLLSVAAGMAGIALLSVMLLEPALFCPVCTVIHVANLALIYPLLLLTRRSPAANIQHFMKTWFQASATSGAASVRVIVFTALLLLPLVFYQWVRIEVLARTVRYTDSFNPVEVLNVHDTTTTTRIPSMPDDAHMGNLEAVVKIVVFSDFQCPGCKMFSRIAKDLLAAYPEDISITFKHFPLNSGCNPLVKGEPHPLACFAANAAEAARMQGKFHQFHDALFQADLAVDSTVIEELAVSAGLSMETFYRDLASPATGEKIAEDVSLALKLGLNSTPTVFINGKQAATINPRAIGLIVAMELRAAGYRMPRTQTVMPPEADNEFGITPVSVSSNGK
jgi:protein-disulfide isomerase